LDKKLTRLQRIKYRKSMQTLGEHFKSNSLGPDEEELLVFCEVIEFLNLPLPDGLETIRDNVILTNKIPCYRENEQDTNASFSYTSNKIYDEIASMLDSNDISR